MSCLLADVAPRRRWAETGSSPSVHLIAWLGVQLCVRRCVCAFARPCARERAGLCARVFAWSCGRLASWL
eukprot:953430-Pleurochrysis_carterae.AAC.4